MEFINEPKQTVFELVNTQELDAFRNPPELTDLTELPSLTELPNLPRLPLPSEITLEAFAGPLPESNKVFDRFYAGAFPGDENNAQNDKNLINLLNAGITEFVCMMAEYNPSASENDWKFRRGCVRPYLDDIRRILAKREQYPSLNATVTNYITFQHFPIKDLRTILDIDTLDAAKKIVASLESGKTVYLHCWGGHGRTGIMVCLVLHLMFKLSAEDAINYCELVHTKRLQAVDVRSPQTDVQREQVKRIIRSLTN